MRIYAEVEPVEALPPRQLRLVVPDSLLGQVWTVPRMRDTPAGLLQVSYSSGRLAQFWQHLSQVDRPRMERILLEELQKLFPRVTRLTSVETHYWDAAVHAWLPSAVFRRPGWHTTFVHAARLPGVRLVGEAVSGVQGWMEGALESVYRALQHAATSRRRPLQPTVTPTQVQQQAAARPGSRYMLVDGRILDVTTWAQRHPGGPGAIAAHSRPGGAPMAEDVGRVWGRIHGHLTWARREMLHLTRGWLKEGQKKEAEEEPAVPGPESK